MEGEDHLISNVGCGFLRHVRASHLIECYTLGRNWKTWPTKDDLIHTTTNTQHQLFLIWVCLNIIEVPLILRVHHYFCKWNDTLGAHIHPSIHVPISIVLSYITSYHITLHYKLYYITLYYIILYFIIYIILYYIIVILYYITLHYIILYYIILYPIISHYIPSIFHYIILHYIPTWYVPSFPTSATFLRRKKDRRRDRGLAPEPLERLGAPAVGRSQGWDWP
jgi:hypothetical protein